MIRHFCASTFIIDVNTNKVLLVHHKDLNKWVQPGGHIENDETPEETAIREAYEETGLKVKLIGPRFPRKDDFIRPLAIQKNTRKEDNDLHIDFTYIAIPDGNQKLKINNESDNIRWFSREELENINVFPDIKISMDYILKHRKKESN